jgi:hypothetical protein
MDDTPSVNYLISHVFPFHVQIPAGPILPTYCLQCTLSVLLFLSTARAAPNRAVPPADLGDTRSLCACGLPLPCPLLRLRLLLLPLLLSLDSLDFCQQHIHSFSPGPSPYALSLHLFSLLSSPLLSSRSLLLLRSYFAVQLSLRHTRPEFAARLERTQIFPRKRVPYRTHLDLP